MPPTSRRSVSMRAATRGPSGSLMLPPRAGPRPSFARQRHRRVVLLDDPPVSHVHVYAAGQAGIEAAHGTHDVDALEALRPVLLEDRTPLHRVLVRAGRTEVVAG